MIAFGQDDLIQLTLDIWVSMLNLTLVPACGSQVNLPKEDGRPFYGGCVQIGGAWEGAVRVDCCQGLARKAAAAFMGVSAGEVTREQVRDAIGELANMSAGSVKPLLPSPCHISLPSVVDGTDYEFTIRKGRRLLVSYFECEGEPLAVSVLEADRNC